MSEKPENDQPLNLPRGSIRAMITLLLTFVVIASFVFSQFTIPNWFYDLWLVAVGYYVGYRTDNSQIKTVD